MKKSQFNPAKITGLKRSFPQLEVLDVYHQNRALKFLIAFQPA